MANNANHIIASERPFALDARAVVPHSIGEDELLACECVSAAHVIRLQSGAILVFEMVSGELARLRTKSDDSELKFSLDAAVEFVETTLHAHAARIFVHRSVDTLTGHELRPSTAGKGTV